MPAGDFELHFQKMGLAALPVGVSCEATFTPDYAHDTLSSGPREGTAAPPADATLGTLPRLLFTAPEGSEVDRELVPVRVLGEGGMGRVLLARQQSLGRDVAVKVLKSAGAHPAAADALIEEARTTGSLEHPGVVPIYALARDGNGLPALVMKRVDGVSWRELLHAPEHPAWKNIGTKGDRLEDHLGILIHVCNAIAHAHLRGVIHRDIKPANVLLGELGEIYVADWGVAIQKDAQRAGPPRLVGTPAYLAPEMVTGDPRLMDERTDVYLLGATLCEVLTGAPPHLGGDLHQVLEKAWNCVPPKAPAQVPAGLWQICLTALAANPRDRFPSVIALRDALRLFLESRGSTRLAEAAAVRLGALEKMSTAKGSEAETRRWYQLVSECRFGFAQALETDPLNATALTGLQRCLEVATRRELEHEAAGSARAFLAEMKTPPPELVDAVRALEAKEAQRTEREKTLKQLERELDPSVFAKQRNVVMLLLGVAVGLSMLTFTLTGKQIWSDLVGRWWRMLPMTLVAIVYVIAVLLNRRGLFSTRVNRQLTMVTALCCAFGLIGRAESVLSETPIHVALARDALTLSGMVMVCAALLQWRFVFTALCFLAGSFACLVWPENAAGIFATASSVGLFGMVALYRLWLRDTDDKGVFGKL